MDILRFGGDFLKVRNLRNHVILLEHFIFNCT